MSRDVSKLWSRNRNPPSTPSDDDSEYDIEDFAVRDDSKENDREEVLLSTCPAAKSNPLEFRPIFNFFIWKDP